MIDTSHPRVSIIIPVYNGETTLKACLDSLLNLDYPSSELDIILVDDGSSDSTPQIGKQFQVRLLTTAHEGPSTARNLGIKHAQGDFVAFTDADCIVDPQWIKELLTGFPDDETIASVGGCQRAVPDDPPFANRIQQLLELLDFLGGYTKGHQKITPVEHNPSCNVMYRKKCLFAVGGFLPGLFPGEDVELDYRLRRQGYTLLYQPEAIVYHHRPRTYRHFFRMIFGYGKGSGGFILRRYGLIRPFQLFFPLFLFLFLADFIMMLKSPIIFLIFHLILFLTLGVVIFGKVRHLDDTIHIMILFLLTLGAWNLGFLRGLFWTKPASGGPLSSDTAKYGQD
ncbi:glycosyltransferase [candidate division CSSED10-310 bacterium]|uniref:Glycosyltransferase n=1 Tax=candidate division CSSED10-310 bacterium TaxID=2855610 RepID=A0ABV6YZJ3_UNCC1